MACNASMSQEMTRSQGMPAGGKAFVDGWMGRLISGTKMPKHL
jgi:hypothetical protein